MNKCQLFSINKLPVDNFSWIFFGDITGVPSFVDCSICQAVMRSMINLLDRELME
jgi:hypothetical protein